MVECYFNGVQKRIRRGINQINDPLPLESLGMIKKWK